MSTELLPWARDPPPISSFNGRLTEVGTVGTMSVTGEEAEAAGAEIVVLREGRVGTRIQAI